MLHKLYLFCYKTLYLFKMTNIVFLSNCLILPSIQYTLLKVLIGLVVLKHVKDYNLQATYWIIKETMIAIQEKILVGNTYFHSI
jgi:hypothetical protein